MAATAPEAAQDATQTGPAGPTGDIPGAPPVRAEAPAPRRDFLSRIPWWLVPLLLLGIPAVAYAAVQVEPQLYDDVVWQYYWGPIKADAEDFKHLCLAPDGGEVGIRGDTETVAYAACVEAGGSEAQSGYNLVNTATWAVLLMLCIVGVAQMLRALGTQMDSRLIVGATLWTVAGSVYHALEDTGLIAPPLQYVFITPPIYLLFAAFGITAFLVGKYLEAMQRRGGLATALQKLWIYMAIVPLGALLLWADGWSAFERLLNPIPVVMLWAGAFLAVRTVAERRGRFEAPDLVWGAALPVLGMSLLYVLWYERDPWSASQEGMPLAFVWAPLLAGTGTLAVWMVAKGASGTRRLAAPAAIAGLVALAAAYLLRGGGERGEYSESAAPIAGLLGAMLLLGAAGMALAASRAKRRAADAPKPAQATGSADPAPATAGTDAPMPAAAPAAAPSVPAWVAFVNPVNLLIVFAQLCDAFATALGIDFHGYEEKHVLSARVIEVARGIADDAGWEWGVEHATIIGFVPVKLLVSLLVIYAMDVKGRDDPDRNETLIGLAKFAIIMVGIGPGVRDFTRLSLGV